MSDSKSLKIPELLAPAGDPASALTAFDAGADAIYAGLNKFNARERSDNFSLDDMSRIITYAHNIKRKVYIALNTLIKESELPEIMQYLADISKLSPDAVIVQDLGVLRLLREYFPEIEIHASTQMGFHNSAGINVAQQLGVKRVIMERQVTLDELKLIVPASPLELEVFVHGALCCSLSGQCLFSSWLGGASGNRGKCKQPCRRRFFSKDGNGFFFSTQDLSALELIPQLKQIGVSSLKIEGRLRKPDYVKNVVSAYRLMLDGSDTADRKLLGEARNILSGTCGRKWSHGFFSEESAASLIQHDAIGSAGIYCGKIALVEPNGFKFTTSKRIHLGDRVRIQSSSGEESPTFTISRLSVDGQSVTKATPGKECFIFYDRETPFRGMVFKIGESYEDLTSRLKSLSPARTSLDLRIDIGADRITIKQQNTSGPVWQSNVILAPAKKHALNAEQVIAEFQATRSEDVQAGNIKVNIHGEYFLASSELKRLRREFWNWSVDNIPLESIASSAAVALERFHNDYSQMHKHYKIETVAIETVAVRPSGPLPGKRQAIKASSIFDFNKLTEEVILPAFCPETKLPSLTKMIKAAWDSGIKRFRVSSLFGLELLKDYQEAIIIAGYPLPVCNSIAANELSERGVARVQAWLELERREIEAITLKSPIPVEVYRYGRPSLLATRAKIPATGEVRDARDNNFILKYEKRTGMTNIYSKEVFSVPRIINTYDFYDLTNAEWNEHPVAVFNFETGLL